MIISFLLECFSNSFNSYYIPLVKLYQNRLHQMISVILNLYSVFHSRR